jgi:hypothetical protein
MALTVSNGFEDCRLLSTVVRRHASGANFRGKDGDAARRRPPSSIEDDV